MHMKLLNLRNSVAFLATDPSGTLPRITGLCPSYPNVRLLYPSPPMPEVSTQTPATNMDQSGPGTLDMQPCHVPPQDPLPAPAHEPTDENETYMYNKFVDKDLDKYGKLVHSIHGLVLTREIPANPSDYLYLYDMPDETLRRHAWPK